MCWIVDMDVASHQVGTEVVKLVVRYQMFRCQESCHSSGTLMR